MPYSGPASAYSTIGKLHAAYFKQVNEQGGIHGRMIELISLDDGYSPPKTLEQTRKLVEQDHVLAVFQSVGTAANTAIHKYLNVHKVPQLFASTGATKWADPSHFPWTIGFNPSYQREGRTYAAYILAHVPNPKIAVLYQNDDFGKDLLKGLRDGLGERADLIVAEASYETSDPRLDSQISTLKSSGANTFVDITTPKFAAQAVRAAYDTGWKPLHFLNNVGSSIGTALIPAGLDKAVGLITTLYIKDPNDHRWDADPAMEEFKTFMRTRYPEGDLAEHFNPYAYISAQTLVQVLQQCGDDVSAANIIKQASSLKGFSPGLLLPGVVINTAADDFELFDQVHLARFDGTHWVLM
jgi:ABC-type branched-subunit amino acid transport system substrate-binding protein